MPTPTYTPLANITLGSSAASVTFSSISQAYRDLILVSNFQKTTDTFYMRVQFNGDTGANYNSVAASGNGSIAQSSKETNITYLKLQGDLAAGTTGNFNGLISIMDYSNTDKHKSILSRDNLITTTDSGTAMTAGRWANTSSITSVLVYMVTGSFAAGSTFALYGIAA